MKISSLLKPEAIAIGAAASSKDDAISKLVDLMTTQGNVADRDAYEAAVHAREDEGTTALGEGIAIPHAKTSAVTAPGLAAMTLPAGVDYDAPDGQPTTLMFLIAAPDTKADVHLEVLSRLSTLLMDPEFCASLRDAKDPAEFLAAIDAAESNDEKLALIESQLSDACQIICDIYSRFLFESSVFEARPQEFLDADRLCQLMLEAQKKAYGDGLDQTCLHPYMWLCKGHYYSGSLSFYNFPYAFGGLFARGLYAKYQQEGEKFVPLYKEMLHATSVNDVEDTAKIAGIDLTDKAFWRQGLQSLADEIDLFCDLVK